MTGMEEPIKTPARSKANRLLLAILFVVLAIALVVKWHLQAERDADIDRLKETVRDAMKDFNLDKINKDLKDGIDARNAKENDGK